MNNNPFKGKSIFDLAKEEGIELNIVEEKKEDTPLIDNTEEVIENEKIEDNIVNNELEELKEELKEVISENENLEETITEDIDNNQTEEQTKQIEGENKEEVEASPKFVMIVGAYGGLGRASMDAALKLGYLVFALDKRIDLEFNNEYVMPIECDVTDINSLNNAYNVINDYTDRLEAIINCAGVFYFDSMVEGDELRLRNSFDINFFGTYRINKLFIPFLAKGAKIINVTSEVAGYSPQPFMGCYSISKKMLDCYNDVLRRELNYVGIMVVKVESGSFKTSLLSNAYKEFDRMYEETEVYKKQLLKLKYMMERELDKNNSPKKFQKVIEKILKAKRPKIRYRINRSKSLRFLNFLPEEMQDRIYKKVI